MCAACKDASACQCKPEDCTASQGHFCSKCGHESTVPPFRENAPTWIPSDQSWATIGPILEAYRHRAESFVPQMSGRTFVPPPPYYDNLLAIVAALVMEHRTSLDYEIAVILCQMAAELMVEQVVTVLAERQQREVPEEVLYDGQYVNGNLVNEKVRRFYNSLCDSPIGDQSFWGAYKAHVDLRNRVVHRRQHAAKEEAQASCDTVRRLIDYLKSKHNVG